MASGTEQTTENTKFRRLFIFVEHLNQALRSADGRFVVLGWSLGGMLGWWHWLEDGKSLNISVDWFLLMLASFSWFWLKKSGHVTWKSERKAYFPLIHGVLLATHACTVPLIHLRAKLADITMRIHRYSNEVCLKLILEYFSLSLLIEKNISED